MAKSIVRRATKTVLLFLNVLVSLLFLVACLSPYISPAHWWINGFTGLGVPYLILALVFFLIFWLVAKPKLVWVPLLSLAVGWQQIQVVFALHPLASFRLKPPKEGLRIVHWNVQSFNGLTRNMAIKSQMPERIANSIQNLSPDVICLQEFNSAEQDNHIVYFTKQYPFYIFSKDYQRQNGKYQSGCIIFSKYPIVNQQRIAFPESESFIYADIVKGKDTLRIFTTHLQSFKFKKNDYDDIEKIKDQEDEQLMASKNILRKMKLAFSQRGVQADMLRAELDNSPYPAVLSGDFNDVPNSYAYFKIRGDWTDAFLKKGFGIGRTFLSLAPTLRIDYIFADPAFEVQQFDMIDEDLSDHILLVADMRLKK